jgi:hypothetical protein
MAEHVQVILHPCGALFHTGRDRVIPIRRAVRARRSRKKTRRHEALLNATPDSAGFKQSLIGAGT